MTGTQPTTRTTPHCADRGSATRDHPWGHATRQSSWARTIPTIVRHEGHDIWHDQGRCNLDGPAELDEIEQIPCGVLTEAWTRL